MKQILCVEDNREVQILVRAVLAEYMVVCASSLEEAKRYLREKNFDLIILDIELPDGDGLKMLTEINHIRTPIFILSSKAETANKVIAFSLGVDDFISKPFDPIELNARISAKLRKMDKDVEEKNIIRIKDLIVDGVKQRIYLTRKNATETEVISLTSTEFRLLMTFVKSPDRVYSREQLLDKVWGTDINITDRTVDTHVNHLRKKIKNSQVKIETILNEGYRLLP